MVRVHGREPFFLFTNFYVHFFGIRVYFWNIGHWFWFWEETVNFGYSAQLDLVFLQVQAYEFDFLHGISSGVLGFWVCLFHALSGFTLDYFR